jgi:hypothetical protein
MKYFKEFCNYLEQNYIAALAISSEKISPDSNSSDLVTEFGSVVPFIGPVFKILQMAKDYIKAECTKNQSKNMAQIAHNTSSFNDLVGTASIEITLQKH